MKPSHDVVAVAQVAAVTRREQARRPPPPFTTSTMQQEASAKLGFSPSRTMTLAQQLYEGPEEAGGAAPDCMAPHQASSPSKCATALRGAEEPGSAVSEIEPL